MKPAQVKQTGQQLALRQVAGRAEQHDHLWKSGTYARRNLRHHIDRQTKQ
jgi:hypothetical protein